MPVSRFPHSKPCECRTFRRPGEVVLMCICLPFEGDCSVRPVMVAINNKPRDILQYVKQIEGDEEQFPLLGGMDSLVVHDP